MTSVIVEAAINGATPRERNPNVPLTPKEIAADALCCLAAGAAIVHNHVDDVTLTGTAAAERYLERGGHVRVGLEDYAGARTPSNAELVEEVVRLARQVGRPVASPTQAARLLGLER
jgi:uncharacterized protein (DUF849 family)